MLGPGFIVAVCQHLSITGFPTIRASKAVDDTRATPSDAATRPGER